VYNGIAKYRSQCHHNAGYLKAPHELTCGIDACVKDEKGCLIRGAGGIDIGHMTRGLYSTKSNTHVDTTLYLITWIHK